MSGNARISLTHDGTVLVAALEGSWRIQEGIPSLNEVIHALEATPHPERLRLVPGTLERWDTSLVLALRRLQRVCTERAVELDVSALPAEAQRMLEAARDAIPEPGARKIHQREDALARLRRATPIADRIGTAVLEALEFVGQASAALGRLLTGRTRRLDLELGPAVYEGGASMLPVLALIAIVGGAVLSLLATQQLDKLGATLLAPNLVAIVIVRELSALTAGLTLAGRWASATAAELAGKVTEDEVESLRAMGVDPLDLLVAPRLLSLLFTGPLLVLYATAFGLLGSVVVGVALMDLPLPEYLDRTREALGFEHAVAGLVKGVAFGFVVGMAGCFHGLRSGRGITAIGRSVKAAVVSAILWVVVADAVVGAFLKWARY